MATPNAAINNGIFLRERYARITSDIDEANLIKLLDQHDPYDLGVLDIWAMARKPQGFLFRPSDFKMSNIITIDDPEGKFTFSLPVNYEDAYIVDDIEPGNVKKGINGSTFRIKINKNVFFNGDIVSYDPRVGQEVLITQHEPVDAGDGFIYTCKVHNGNSTDFLDNTFLRPGTRWFRKTNALGEQDLKYGGVSSEVGKKQYYSLTGIHKLGKELHVTERAAYLAGNFSINGRSVNTKVVTEEGLFRLIDVFTIKDKTLDPGVVIASDTKRLKQLAKSGAIGWGVITKLEQLLLDSILQDIDMYMMWGLGGISNSAHSTVRTMAGLWKQLDNQYKTIYTKSTFSLGLFRELLSKFLYGRVDFDNAQTNKVFEFRCGRGFAHLFHEAAKRELSGSGFTFRGDEGGAKVLTGDRMNLRFGYQINEYIIPYIGTVRLVIDPVFEGIETNDILNPVIDGGFRLSSYSAILLDVNQGQPTDNILIFKHAQRSKLMTFYINGTMDYKMSTNFQATGQFNGFKIQMHTYAPTCFVKDPTRVAKLVMRNPITGGSF